MSDLAKMKAEIERLNTMGDTDAFVDAQAEYIEALEMALAVERSSLGTSEAQALRATVSDERARAVVARSMQIAPDSSPAEQNDEKPETPRCNQCRAILRDQRNAPVPSEGEQNDETEREAAWQEFRQYAAEENSLSQGFSLYKPTPKEIFERGFNAGRRSYPAATTHEWEYGARVIGTNRCQPDNSDGWSAAAAYPNKWEHVRRSPAGPWLPVPKEGE